MKKYIALLFLCVNILNAQEKIELLDEVVVMGQKLPKHATKKQLKGKKYFVTLSNHNVLVISNHYQKRANDLVGMKFVFDAVELQSDTVFVRPLLMTVNKEEIVVSSKHFPLDYETKEVIFNFLQAIPLKEKTNYLIGFEIVDKNRTKKVIKVQSVNTKGSYSLFKSSPTSDWWRQDNGSQGYSLDYELFFMK
ncbi:hypothetical protein [Capnocytophaga canis]|uniref:Uncharacterized protein n=1 Tax=Capnocytophaga canis TaxID=1848903 RepID=A0A0B7IR70_9FLAO|nr:hypothetical protein [Capnocytophaga canis]CEN52458.1 conserved exported hypothetical protein [Capnocytophaga canis]